MEFPSNPAHVFHGSPPPYVEPSKEELAKFQALCQLDDPPYEGAPIAEENADWVRPPSDPPPPLPLTDGAGSWLPPGAAPPASPPRNEAPRIQLRVAEAAGGGDDVPAPPGDDNCYRRFWRTAGPVLEHRWQQARPALQMLACAAVVAVIFGGTFYLILATERAVITGSLFTAQVGLEGMKAGAIKAAATATHLFQQFIIGIVKVGVTLKPYAEFMLKVFFLVLLESLNRPRYRY